MDMLTELRYYHFIAGVLANQQQDPLCSRCKAFTNCVERIREEVKAYMVTNAGALTALPEQDQVMPVDINMMLDGLHPLPDAVGQKKAGNCLLPQGVCFVKSPKALREKMEQGS